MAPPVTIEQLRAQDIDPILHGISANPRVDPTTGSSTNTKANNHDDAEAAEQMIMNRHDDEISELSPAKSGQLQAPATTTSNPLELALSPESEGTGETALLNFRFDSETLEEIVMLDANVKRTVRDLFGLKGENQSVWERAV